MTGWSAGQVPEALLTVAESSDYRATADEQQVRQLLARLAGLSPKVRLEQIGETVEGRPLEALVIGGPQAAPQLPLPAEDPRLTVLLLGGIHSGESDGKEALLALSRDFLLAQNGSPWWEKLVLVVLPNFNADGNERMGPLHRPGQVGPIEGMGLRENAQGLDLNRDFVKLDSPEVRSLVAAMERWRIDCLIDMHTTNGSLHRYDLTYDLPHNPAAPEAVRRLLRKELLPAVTQRLNEQGIATFYYGNFSRDHRRWESFGHEPRYSTEYAGMRGVLGILSESYSYASYERRIEAGAAFVTACLDWLAENDESVREAIGTPWPEAGEPLPLQAKMDRWPETVEALGYAYPERVAEDVDGGERPPRFPSPADLPRLEQLIPTRYEVELHTRFVPTAERSLPWAYAVPAECSWGAERLLVHGVELYRLEEPLVLPVESLRICDAERLVDFQQRPIHRWVVEAEPVVEQVLPAGTILVPVQQRLGRLAAYLLEPDSDDSLARWGFFQGLMEVGQPYPVLRLMAEVPLEGLQRLRQVPAGERLTIEKLFDPARQISLAGDRWPLPRWLPDRSAYVVERTGDAWPLVVEASSGAQQVLGAPARMARALAALEPFSQAEAREAVRSLDRFDAKFQWGLVTHRQQLFFYSEQTQTAKALTAPLAAPPQLAELSPDGSQVAYVLDHDLYVVATSEGTPIRLTHDGSPDRLNGILDWVYQEEIYGRGNFKGFWWSPDSRQLAWLQLDQTPVDRFSVTDSIPNLQSVEVTRYPKSGQPLPTAKLMMVNLDAVADVRSVTLEGYSPDDLLIVRVDWHPGQPWLTAQLQNRAQTWLDLVKIDAANRSVERLWREEGPAWIDRLEAPHWLADGTFLWLSDLPEGWRRLVRVDPATQQQRVLTQGDWEVSGLVAVSPDERYAWVVGNPGSLIESHLMRVELASGQWQKLTGASGTHQPLVSADGEYFLDLHSAIDRPWQIDLNDASGGRVRVVASGTNDRHRALQVSPPRLFTIPAADGQPLQSMLLLPPGFDPQTQPQTERLPVVMYVYGGPAAPTVKQAWGERNYWWHQFLAQQGYAVLLCDNRSARGTHRGQTWQIHRDLGRVELADVEAAAGWLKEQSWVDAERIGIWGWSYGGYLTALVMTHSDRFRAGIAGAPVTDWHLYDAIYTERYMGLPQDNPEGYRRSSVVLAAEHLAGELLLVHGEQDDNVHMQNTLQLAHALQLADRPFELMIYPQNRHAVTAPRQRLHLHRLMFSFWERHLRDARP